MANLALSVRLHHPTLDPELITAGMGMPPTRCWEKGAPRMTPRGDQLDGSYPSTYWYRNISVPPGCLLDQALRRAVELLRPARPFLADFVEGGGTAELFIGWFHGPGATLDREMLRELAALHLELALDVYLPPAGPQGA
jgi:hypothetical protein